MATVTVLPINADPERLTRRPAGLGPLWSLCPKCKGSGLSASAPKSDELSMVSATTCSRCAGKGMVLE